MLDKLRSALSEPPKLLDMEGNSHAAVALIIRIIENVPEVLLIERATNENDPWSGHLAMPGGRVEDVDNCPRDAAARETLEETGISLETTQYLGQLGDVHANGIPIVISCYVFILSGDPPMQLAEDEVADAFWTPLDVLQDPAMSTHITHTDEDQLKRFPAVKIPGKTQPLWGITYKLLRNLVDSL